MKTDLNEDDANVNCGVRSDVNLGFGSRSRVKSSVSDWGEFELARTSMGKGSRTEVETPSAGLALALSPRPSFSKETSRGDTRSAHVRDPDVLRHAKFRFSPTDVRPLTHDDRQEERDKPPHAVGPHDLDNLSSGSPSPDSGMQSCSTTAGSLSPRTELFPGSGSSEIREDYDSTAHALRRRLGSDGLNEMGAGKMKMGGGGSENDFGGMGFMNGHHQSRHLSMNGVDDVDNGGEFDRSGLSGVSGRVERCAWVDDSQDWEALSSRCSSADANAGSGSRSPPIGAPTTILPCPTYSALASDCGSVPGSRLWHHVDGQYMGVVLSPGSRSHLVPHQMPISGSLEAFTPSFPLTSPKAIPFTRDTRVPRDNAGLNAYQSTSWLDQTQEHVHPQARDFDALRFSSSSPSRSISVSASPSISVPRHLLLDKDKLDEDRDSVAGRSGPGLVGRLPLNTELRSDMKVNMTPNSSTRTELNGNAERALLNRDTLAPLTSNLINNRGDGNGSISRHADGIERGDMGGSGAKKLGSLNLGGRVSTVFISAFGVSGVSAAGSPPTPAPATWPHHDGEDARSIPRPVSRTMSVQSRSNDQEEPEECELLKSLLESSDPWGLMKKKVLNLPSPTPSEIERRGRKEQDTVRVTGSYGRRGVGYVTPPSLDALLEVVGPSADVEMEKIGDGGRGDEDSQEILDFRSSQPRTDRLSFRRIRRVGVDSLIRSVFRSLPDIHYGSSVSGLPPSDFASTSTMDIFSDPLGYHSSSPQFRSYRDRNHDDNQYNLGPDSQLHVTVSSPCSSLQPRRRDEMGSQPTPRKRSRRSSDSEGSEEFTFTDQDLDQVGDKRKLSGVTLSPSKFEPDFGVVPKSKLSPNFLNLPFASVSIPVWMLPAPAFHKIHFEIQPFIGCGPNVPYQNVGRVLVLGVHLPRLSTSAERWLIFHSN